MLYPHFINTCHVVVVLHVQVGDDEPQEELLMMCDDPSSQHFYRVDTYSQLMDVKTRLLEALCDGMFTRSLYEP